MLRRAPSTPPPTPEPTGLTLDDVAEQVRKSLVKVSPLPYNCTHCYVLTNHDSTDHLCRSCSHHGERPDLLIFTARKLGFTTGAPSDLLEILGRTLSEDEIWEADHETLARVWDEQTSMVLPTTCEVRGVVRNGRYVNVTEFGNEVTYPPRQRPPTTLELETQKQAVLDQQSADTQRVAAARLKTAERQAEKAKDALDKARQNFEASL